MATPDWSKVLDLQQASTNLRHEFVGDWHRDPWDWPELRYVASKNQDLVAQNCESDGIRQVFPIDVPKENWGSRPAVVLDIVDRITYQALVDRLSIDLIAALPNEVFGWRLPARSPKRGTYSTNKNQWDLYRDHLSTLAGLYPVALKTDIVSFFASMSLAVVEDELAARAPGGSVADRLASFLQGFSTVPERSGIPQRSLASSVIANTILGPIDDVLAHTSHPLPGRARKGLKYRSFARWMDDMWLFGHDAGQARAAQIELQHAAQSRGLALNSAKTELLEGAAVAEQAREVEHSAVDDALIFSSNQRPLEELIEKILVSPDTANRTSVKFAARRMRDFSGVLGSKRSPSRY